MERDISEPGTAMELQDKAAYSNEGSSGNKTTEANVSNEKAILLEKRRRVSAKAAVKLRLAAIAVSWLSTIVALVLGVTAIGFIEEISVSANAAVKLRLAAIFVSWLSTIVALVLGVTAIAFAWIYDSQSLFGFGIDALLDCVSSIIILWRFHSGTTIYSDEKETKACIAIGILFNVSGAVLVGKSIAALVLQELSERPRVVLILAAVNCFLCLVLGVSKVILGQRLESRALLTDSITTLVGAVMSLFTLVFSVVYTQNKSLWYLDDAFGIACAIFLVCYGIRVIVVSIAELRSMKKQTE